MRAGLFVLEEKRREEMMPVANLDVPVVRSRTTARCIWPMLNIFPDC